MDAKAVLASRAWLRPQVASRRGVQLPAHTYTVNPARACMRPETERTQSSLARDGYNRPMQERNVNHKPLAACAASGCVLLLQPQYLASPRIAPRQPLWLVLVVHSSNVHDILTL